MNNPSLGKHLFTAVIPAFNESENIEKVISAVLPYANVLVVDDGSSDNTALLARRAGAEVVSHTINKGYDQALESGLLRAIELGFEYAITMDGDGQHVPETLDLFKKKLADGVDLVVGVRDRHQRVAESFFSLVSSVLWGIKDPLCGMKGYRLILLKRTGKFHTYKSIGTEFTLIAARSGFRIDQIDVPTRNRTGDSRFGSGFKPNLIIFNALIIGLFKIRILPYPPSSKF